MRTVGGGAHRPRSRMYRTALYDSSATALERESGGTVDSGRCAHSGVRFGRSFLQPPYGNNNVAVQTVKYESKDWRKDKKVVEPYVICSHALSKTRTLCHRRCGFSAGWRARSPPAVPAAVRGGRGAARSTRGRRAPPG